MLAMIGAKLTSVSRSGVTVEAAVVLPLFRQRLKEAIAIGMKTTWTPRSSS
jgi:hypothetical protein